MMYRRLIVGTMEHEISVDTSLGGVIWIVMKQ
jgi:hypothetical protein